MKLNWIIFVTGWMSFRAVGSGLFLFWIFTENERSAPSEWIFNWKKNGWRTANKKEVSNKELWTELDLLNSEFEISWNWVKAHSTDKLNNEVDLLARDAANL